MVIYKTMEVQKKLKELLDKVDAGEQVRIQRRGTLYVVLDEEQLQEFVNLQFQQRVDATKNDLPVHNPEYDTDDPPVVVDTSSIGEFPCCAGKKRCKHWSWDTTTGDGYVNSLSERFMEAS